MEIDALKETLDSILLRLNKLEDQVYERTYTTSEAAAFLGCTRQTITKYRNMGIINPISGTTRYTLKELIRVKNRK